RRLHCDSPAHAQFETTSAQPPGPWRGPQNTRLLNYLTVAVAVECAARACGSPARMLAARDTCGGGAVCVPARCNPRVDGAWRVLAVTVLKVRTACLPRC